jgi:hypothetical protein
MMQHQKIEKKYHQSSLCFYWHNFARKEKFKIQNSKIQKKKSDLDCFQLTEVRNFFKKKIFRFIYLVFSLYSRQILKEDKTFELYFSLISRFCRNLARDDCHSLWLHNQKKFLKRKHFIEGLVFENIINIIIMLIIICNPLFSL